TPTSSEAPARMVTVDLRATVAPSAGLVIDTLGAVTSIGGGGEGRGVPCTARNASTRPLPNSWSNPGSPRSLAVPSMRERASRLVRLRDINKAPTPEDLKSTRLNSSHGSISYAV